MRAMSGQASQRLAGAGASSCCQGGLLAALDAELGEDLGYVELGSAQGDSEALCDLLVGQPLAQERQHLPLAWSEDIGVRRPTASVQRP